MRIGFMCPFGKLGCGESEARARFIYCMKEQGHYIIELDENNFDYATGEYAENLNLDFVISHAVTEQKDTVFPDVYSCFLYWCPSAFLDPQNAIDYLLYMNKHDTVVGGYESKDTLVDLYLHDYFHVDRLESIFATIPRDWSIHPVKKDHYSLFYIGMNVGKNGRYETLIQYLDNQCRLRLYGPRNVFGKRNTYSKLKSYRGEIPFDGRTILKEINDAGICLAIDSIVHNGVDYVSNRIFEAAAAGAVIIADDNAFIKRYFGDSVYYVNVNKAECEIIDDIIAIVDIIEKFPNEAYKKACDAQTRFMEKLTLDSQIMRLVDYVMCQKSIEYSADNGYPVIDIICECESIDDFIKIKQETDKQSYKNIKYIVKCNRTLKFELDRNDYKGVILISDYAELPMVIKDEFFIFVNKYSCMHSNHIYKNYERIVHSGKKFSYSGTYIKEKNGYRTLNNDVIHDRDVEILFDYKGSCGFEMEERLALSSFLFRRTLLDNVDIYELKKISSSIHLFLMLVSIYRLHDLGTFTYALTSGYKDENYKRYFEAGRRLYRLEGRSWKLFQYEIGAIFSKERKMSDYSATLRNIEKNLYSLLRYKKMVLRMKRKCTFILNKAIKSKKMGVNVDSVSKKIEEIDELNR